MSVASLDLTFAGTALGAFCGAHASVGNSSDKDPVQYVLSGALYGAVLPTVIKTAHLVATKVLGFATSQLDNAWNLASKLGNRAVSTAVANPYATAALGLGALVVLGLTYGSKAKEAAPAEKP